MKYDPLNHDRHSIRLKGYDYSARGSYFLTICSHGRECLFGDVVGEEMRLSEIGDIVGKCWAEIPNHFANVRLDKFVVMPNHVHGILALGMVGTRHAVSLPRTEQFGKPTRGSVPTIIRSFKSAATKRINRLRGIPGCPVWQGRFHDHIIRNDADLHRIREYIETNPAKWASDEENPDKR